MVFFEKGGRGGGSCMCKIIELNMASCLSDIAYFVRFVHGDNINKTKQSSKIGVVLVRGCRPVRYVGSPGTRRCPRMSHAECTLDDVHVCSGMSGFS